MTSDSLPPVVKDRRTSPRQRVLQTGILVSANGQYTWDCSIRDISTTGARVAVAAVNLTEITYLIHVRAEIAFEVKVARASSREVGLTFLKRLPLDRNLDQNLLFLWRLCLERASR